MSERRKPYIIYHVWEAEYVFDEVNWVGRSFDTYKEAKAYMECLPPTTEAYIEKEIIY